MRSIVSSDRMRVADLPLLLRTIEVYQRHRLAFADAYLVASAERSGVGVVVSFDKGISKVGTVERVEPDAWMCQAGATALLMGQSSSAGWAGSAAAEAAIAGRIGPLRRPGRSRRRPTSGSAAVVGAAEAVPQDPHRRPAGCARRAVPPAVGRGRPAARRCAGPSGSGAPDQAAVAARAARTEPALSTSSISRRELGVLIEHRRRAASSSRTAESTVESPLGVGSPLERRVARRRRSARQLAVRQPRPGRRRPQIRPRGSDGRPADLVQQRGAGPAVGRAGSRCARSVRPAGPR